MFKNDFTLELKDGETKTVSLKIKPPTDVLMFVPGTTDPTNNKSLLYEANASYWRGKKHNLWEELKKLKLQYLDLHIEDKFFSWSGDNNTEERKKAAERLLDLFLRVYSEWTNREVHLHLIGHSHGGNVINQFTELIATDSKFPRFWKVKSLVYLSTPFFREKHQLNHAKIHPQCKVINVYNRYDITQRFIADFSLNNLEGIVKKLSTDEYERITNEIMEAVGQLQAAFSEAYGALDWVINNDTEGPLIWERTVTLFDRVREFTKLLIKDINTFQPSSLQQELTELQGILVAIDNWVENTRNTFQQNQANRDGGYGPNEFVEDLNIMGVVILLNRILAIEGTLESSALIDLMARAFREQHDIVDSIDDTTWTPREQLQGKYPIVYKNITTKDVYDTRNRSANYQRFASGVENSMKAGNLHEVLMRLISQFIDPGTLGIMITVIDNIIEPFVSGNAQNQMEELRLNLTDYRTFVTRFNCDLIAEIDQQSAEAASTAQELATATKSLEAAETALQEAERVSTTASNAAAIAQKEAMNAMLTGKSNAGELMLKSNEASQTATEAATTVQEAVEAVTEATEVLREAEEVAEEAETAADLLATTTGLERAAVGDDNSFIPPGSVPYLAMVSHGLSHTHLWDEVEEGLRDSFSSGENPGYKE